MLWFYLMVIAAVALALWFYRARQVVRPGSDKRRGAMTEASAEIGAPPEVVDRDKSLLSDRLLGVERPMVSPPKRVPSQDGSLRDRELRKDNLSKEVELDWEASDLIETQPGAYARPEDFRDEPSRGFLGRTGEAGALPDLRDAREKRFPEDGYALPDRYGKDRLVLMARDPKWVYAYWEVAHDRYQELRQRRLDEWGLSRPVLRLYDLTEPSPDRQVLDVDLNDDAQNWYIRVNRPRHRLIAEIGRVFPDGFISLLRSNEVSLPPDSPSMEIALEWAPFDWEGNYGAFAGDIGVSSPGARGL